MGFTGNTRVATLLAILVAAILGAATVSDARVHAEPLAYQLWSSKQSPRQGRTFVGVNLTLLQQSSVTLRPESVRFRCSPGVIRGRGRVRSVPVTTTRIGRENGEPGPVIAVWSCVWQVPPGTAGLRLTAGYTRSAIDVDPVTGRETGRSEDGGALSWQIRR